MDTISLVSHLTQIAIRAHVLDDAVQARLRSLRQQDSVPVAEVVKILEDQSYIHLSTACTASAMMSWAEEQDAKAERMVAALEERLMARKP